MKHLIIQTILRILKFFCDYQLKENKIISRQFVKDLLLPELLQFYWNSAWYIFHRLAC